MSKTKIPKSSPRKVAGATPQTQKPDVRKSTRRPLWQHLPILPIPVIVFLIVWWWAACWQGDVFRMARENSFFAPDSLLMQFELCKPYGTLWTMGRSMLMLFRYPWLGGLLLSAMLTLSCWLLGYAMRLSARWRWIQWLPLGIYTFIFTYSGMNNYFEAETGQALGIPLCILLILIVWGIIIRSFSRKHSPALLRRPADESLPQNYLQLLVVLCVGILPSVIFGQWQRAYVRPIAHMQVGVMEQDWQEVIRTAEANADLSYRPFAAQYAIALVQTQQVADRFFNIRLEYDTLHVEGMNGHHGNALNTYLMECDYHAGLVQTAYHHAMESMAMEGPTLRNLKMMCKTALLRGEWEVAEKYLYILDKVPLEGDFVRKYSAMVRNEEAINSDPEFLVVRNLEPIHDHFENQFMPPVFLGYNAIIDEFRSTNALYNNLMVSIYTKTTQNFLMRCQPLAGQNTPVHISQALALLSGKTPQLLEAFPGCKFYRPDMANFLTETTDLIHDRAGITEAEKAELLRLGFTPSGSDSLTSAENRALHARQLFPKYKGFYPYYYFFGNLKATKKSDVKESSNAGVN